MQEFLYSCCFRLPMDQMFYSQKTMVPCEPGGGLSPDRHTALNMPEGIGEIKDREQGAARAEYLSYDIARLGLRIVHKALSRFTSALRRGVM